MNDDNNTVKVLRAFVHEALLHELRRDEQMLMMLQGSGIGSPRTPEGHEARKIALEWIADTELELGAQLSHSAKTQVIRFVGKRWKGLVARFRGDRSAAQQTLVNLLNSKYNGLRTGD